MINTPQQTEIGHDFCCKREGTLCRLQAYVPVEQRRKSCPTCHAARAAEHPENLNGNASNQDTINPSHSNNKNHSNQQLLTAYKPHNHRNTTKWFSTCLEAVYWLTVPLQLCNPGMHCLQLLSGLKQLPLHSNSATMIVHCTIQSQCRGTVTSALPHTACRLNNQWEPVLHPGWGSAVSADS